ncbi:hypothetical protein SCUP515_11990 [Seiridium cupressi]
MGILSLSYRRPRQVDRESFRSSFSTENEKEVASLRSSGYGESVGIPEALAFDRIINGGTCPPMTVRDFMNYLTYIEHSAENLQFFLWYRDYVRRFQEAQTSDISLAPEWTQAMEEEALAKINRGVADNVKETTEAADIFKGTDFEQPSDHVLHAADPFTTPPRTPDGNSDASTLYSSQATTFHTQALDTYTAAGSKQPFTIQPFRTEIERVIATYLAVDASRQLNLSSREHRATIQALAYTTHPSAFRLVVKATENILRRQAHPNFVRWSISNGSPARLCVVLVSALSTAVLATIGAIVLTLSSAPRGYRALFALAWFSGIAPAVAASKGMCVILHGFHHRIIRPWELFEDNDEELSTRSFDNFGGANSYEEAPWVVKYKRRSMLRKVFDREVWIKEPALRQIQNTIFVQSVLSGLVLSGVLTAVFVSVPGGHFY